METPGPALRGLLVSAQLLALDDEGVAVGESGTEPAFRFEPERSVSALGYALAKLHAIVPNDGVRNELSTISPSALVGAARGNPRHASSRNATPSSPYSHMSRERLTDVLASGERDVSTRATTEASADRLVHGSPSLANLRFEGVACIGFAEWSSCFIGDPYWDIAYACRELISLYGPAPVQMFLEAYGEGRVDPVRLDWYSLAVELCG